MIDSKNERDGERKNIEGRKRREDWERERWKRREREREKTWKTRREEKWENKEGEREERESENRLEIYGRERKVRGESKIKKESMIVFCFPLNKRMRIIKRIRVSKW